MSHVRLPESAPLTVFMTASLNDADSRLLVDHIALLRDCVRLAMSRTPFRIEVASVLPASVSMIWTLPAEDRDPAARWRLIGGTFARHVPLPAVKNLPDDVQRAGLWNPSMSWEQITTLQDYQRLEAACLEAPVHAGLVDDPTAWPYSSVRTDPADRSPAASEPSANRPETAEARPPVVQAPEPRRVRAPRLRMTA